VSEEQIEDVEEPRFNYVKIHKDDPDFGEKNQALREEKTSKKVQWEDRLTDDNMAAYMKQRTTKPSQKKEAEKEPVQRTFLKSRAIEELERTLAEQHLELVRRGILKN